MITKDDQIVEGDVVSVFWDHVQNIFEAEVLHAANGLGEVWILKERNGNVSYVMTFSKMVKRKVKPLDTIAPAMNLKAQEESYD